MIRRNVKQPSAKKVAPRPPADRRAGIVGAAVDVFLRYGYARTTMGDIAAGAGISRPTLYDAFPGKEDVFAAAVEALDAQSYAEMHAALPRHRTLEARLRYACKKWGAHGFDITAVHPDARDLFDLNYPAVQAMYGRFCAFVADMIAPAVAASALAAGAPELARSLVFAMRGLEQTAVDGADMRRLIDLQVSALLALLAGRAPE
ncbi:MAG: TetR/AcrR family transcriptional regulator [Gluconacetobacter diazotrophicus]|nr:TetR/AcrR family transcriptional regulator [Gluconacetobacter diazotrophicus]